MQVTMQAKTAVIMRTHSIIRESQNLVSLNGTKTVWRHRVKTCRKGLGWCQQSLGGLFKQSKYIMACKRKCGTFGLDGNQIRACGMQDQHTIPAPGLLYWSGRLKRCLVQAPGSQWEEVHGVAHENICTPATKNSEVWPACLSKGYVQCLRMKCAFTLDILPVSVLAKCFQPCKCAREGKAQKSSKKVKHRSQRIQQGEPEGKGKVRKEMQMVCSSTEIFVLLKGEAALKTCKQI